MLAKYGSHAKLQSLGVSNIRRYGRQVLEALSFLAEKGFVLGILPSVCLTHSHTLTHLLYEGHVHAGNVLVTDGVCQLVDIENSLLGLPLFLRPLLVEIRKIYVSPAVSLPVAICPLSPPSLQSQAAECVYSFGHMLYEMCAGQPLKTATFDESQLPHNVPEAAGEFPSVAARDGLEHTLSVVPVLRSILTAKAIKDGLPTLADLIAIP